MFLILISEQSRLCHCPFSKEETTLLRGALRQLNWAAGIAGREISVQIYEISTKIKTDIIAYKSLIFIKSKSKSYQNTIIWFRSLRSSHILTERGEGLMLII